MKRGWLAGWVLTGVEKKEADKSVARRSGRRERRDDLRKAAVTCGEKGVSEKEKEAISGRKNQQRKEGRKKRHFGDESSPAGSSRVAGEEQ